MERVQFNWNGPGSAVVLFISTPQDRRNLGFERMFWSADKIAFENLWRLRIGAVDPNRGAVSILNTTLEGRCSGSSPGNYTFMWTPTAAQASDLARYCTTLGATDFGTTVWFEDVTGHVNTPEAIAWLSSVKVSVQPATILLGSPVQVTVHAQDALGGVTLPGDVYIDGKMVGPTDKPFTYTFNRRIDRVFDPSIKKWIPRRCCRQATCDTDWLSHFGAPVSVRRGDTQLSYPDGSLVRESSRPEVYVVVGGAKFWIPSGAGV